jgi:hypothetical protein
MYRFLRGLVVAVALTAGAAPAQAHAAETQRITAYLQFSPSSDQPRTLVAANGVINDVGTLQIGGDDASGVHHDTLVLRRGTVDLAAVATEDNLVFNPSTCTGIEIESGTATLSGTGRYAGLSGSGTWVNRGTLVAPWSPGCTAEDVTSAYVVFTFTGAARLS